MLSEHGQNVNCAAFSHDGSRVITASRDSLAIIYDAENGKVLHRLKHDRRVYYCAFSPDDQFVATASYDKTAQLWNAATGLPCYKPFEHMIGVPFADFSPDGRFLVTAGFDTLAKIWDLKTGSSPIHRWTMEPRLLMPISVQTAAFS